MFSELVNTPKLLLSAPLLFMIIEPDEVTTPVLLIIPLLVIVPVGPLVMVPDEVIVPKFANGPLFVIVPPLFVMIPLLLTVPEVVMTPPLAMRIVPSFAMMPLLVTVPMLKTTFELIANVSVGPITRVPTVHVEVPFVQTPPTDGDWHDSASDTVEVTAIAFWAEKTRTEIITTNAGSIRICFMFVIIS